MSDFFISILKDTFSSTPLTFKIVTSATLASDYEKLPTITHFNETKIIGKIVYKNRVVKSVFFMDHKANRTPTKLAKSDIGKPNSMG